MNKTQLKTLADIFAKPTVKTLEWARIEALFVALGCQTIEGSGSRVKFEKDGVRAFFHRPHPAKEAKPYQVELARDFLIELGIKP